MIPTIGEELTSILRARRLSQLKAAERIGCDYSYISRLIAGSRHPSALFIERFAAALHLDEQETIRLSIIAGCIPLGIRQRVLQLVAKGAA